MGLTSKGIRKAQRIDPKLGNVASNDYDPKLYRASGAALAASASISTSMGMDRKKSAKPSAKSDP